MKFEKSNPILWSADIKRSLRYYVEVLGFSESWEWGGPVDFGGVVRDDVEILFCLNNQGNPGTWLAIMVDDVDAYFTMIKARGAKILAEPVDREWFLREMFVEDPDGHVIRFGHRLTCD